VYEQDGGVLWTHTEFGKNRTETRRARQLVIASIATLGNYDYGFNWVFGQDGSLELRVDLMGIVLVKAVAAATCPVCRQQPGEDGRIRPEGEDRFGTLVAKNLVATNHQHFFCFRLDFDVDGTGNSVEELNAVPAPPGKDNPRGNAFLQERTLFRKEQEARRDVKLATRRT
jgi:primary-amine oxidase